MEEIVTNKNEIRQQICELKKQLLKDQKAQAADSVFMKIELLPEFKSAKTILMYWSTTDELPTHKFVGKWSVEKEILLPSVVGDDIVIKKYSAKENLKRGNLGIYEPETDGLYMGKIDLAIVPGVAFDLKRNRLGRGKGYYDRFFNDVETQKWGVGFDFQVVSSVPVNNDDKPMNKVISPTKTIE
ncbi:MAG TPA: 5-formyltetrahydrofolate cyclo-ligase [Paludibacter sp.]|jgi:5-formyltetrahydrofolate cyclo-ligase|nr:5-formyltetrahydrofolate cyclo-ligase [Paludibacter sp.]